MQSIKPVVNFMLMSDNLSKTIPLDPFTRRVFQLHERIWRNNLYIYPVVSRRSKGLSIGINLNPDKVCNFDCIYCSVDRKVPGTSRDVNTMVLRQELTEMLQLAESGEIFRLDPFDKISPELQRINDVAFSGDGEPTTCPVFGECCRIVAEQLATARMSQVKIVLITNATMFARPQVRNALAFLDQHNGEIWAKLDAGTPEYYQLIDRTDIPFSRILANLTWCAQIRPTVIQTLLMRVNHQPPSSKELQAYIRRIKDIRRNGGAIKLVQIYTIARRTAEDHVTPLSTEDLAAIARQVATSIPDVPVEFFP